MARINYRSDDLRALLALHRTSSFIRGAELLHITQSAFSRRIAHLEEAVGACLVERTTRHVALSAQGRDLVREARPLLEALDEVLQNAGRRARGETGRIAIACLTTVAYALLPQALETFRKRFPDVRLQLRDDTAQRVMVSVLERDAEFGVGVLRRPVAGLEAAHLINDPYVIAFSPDHPLARQRQVKWASVSQWRPVALRTTSTHQINEDLAAAGLQPPWFDEVEHFASLLGLLRRGKFVGVVPRLALNLDIGNLQVRPLVQPRIGRRIGLIRRSNAELSKPAEALWNILGAELDRVSAIAWHG